MHGNNSGTGEKIMEAMKRLNDEEFRKKHNREFWGTEIDDYMRRMTGAESYYAEQERKEREEYWTDYAKNTGFEPLYPIMAGEQWNQPISSLPLGLTQLPGKMKAIDMLYGGMM